MTRLIRIPLNQTLDLSFSEFGAAGYLWSWDVVDPAVAVVEPLSPAPRDVGVTAAADLDMPVGGPHRRSYRIVPRKTGQTVVTGVHARPWDPNDTIEAVVFVIEVVGENAGPAEVATFPSQTDSRSGTNEDRGDSFPGQAFLNTAAYVSALGGIHVAA